MLAFEGKITSWLGRPLSLIGDPDAVAHALPNPLGSDEPERRTGRATGSI